MILALFYRSSENHFIGWYSAIFQEFFFFISSKTEKNNYFLLYELIQDLLYMSSN